MHAYRCNTKTTYTHIHSWRHLQLIKFNHNKFQICPKCKCLKKKKKKIRNDAFTYLKWVKNKLQFIHIRWDCTHNFICWCICSTQQLCYICNLGPINEWKIIIRARQTESTNYRESRVQKHSVSTNTDWMLVILY